ncbi:MAG: GNAT family N-acetyltransferase [Bacteriovoracaceae bacterium]|jgi:ribosomal protein S18 acetylase RimI-like enzyme|nr:GNAT family N-acetyltransferase [Bacteriovoracaceae bacterium]
MKIEAIDKSTALLYSEHKELMVSRSGIDGAPIYNPFNQEMLDSWTWQPESHLASMSTELTAPGWKRSWGILEDGKFIGSVDLSGGSVLTNLHRCTLMMGVDRDYKAQGYGKGLLCFAISWAKESGLEWMDLGVFDTNTPAISLYKKNGFIINGEVKDAFYVNGTSIGDIRMSLKL